MSDNINNMPNSYPRFATDTEQQTSVAIDETTDEKQEERWKIIAHDDTVTTMDFVIRLMITVFHKPHIFAEAIMWQVHNEGNAVVDVLPKTEAERRKNKATAAAWMEGFPFKVTIEKA